MLYSIKTFGGMLPRVNPRLLQDQNAQVSTGTKLRSGSLVPFNSPSIIEQLNTPSDTYQTLYQYEHSAEDIFLSFEEDVNIVKGPIANDQYNRTYLTGLDKPRGFDTSLVASTDTTIDSTNSYELAIPVGDSALLATSGTGTGELISRAYTYTYIRTWEDTKFDEGVPSDPAIDIGGSTEYIDVQVGETVTISYIEDAPNQSDNGVNRIAIYRTAVGTSGATYQLVIDFNIAAAKAGTVSGVTWNSGTSTFSYDDTLTDGELGTDLPSATWTAPDDDLRGLISLKNGCLVGFADNVVHFSEPYQLHAWPTAYQVVVDENIVGLGAFGNTVVVLTDKFPILLNAQDPNLIIPQPTQATSPCLSKRGIVNYENTVYFPSSDGLIAVSSEGIQNVTQSAFTSDEWLDYYPTTFESAIQNGRYFGFYQNSSDNSTGFLIVDLEEALAAISTEVFGVSCFHVDRRSDTLYFIQYDDAAGWQILQWEGLASSRTLTWRSKVFTSQIGPANLAACRVRAMYLTQAEIDAINIVLEEQAELAKAGLKGAVNEVPFNVLTFNGDIYTSFDKSYTVIPRLDVRFYVDEDLIHTQEEVSSNKPFRLPAGIVGDYFEIEIESNFPVYQIDFATSMRELQ